MSPNKLVLEHQFTIERPKGNGDKVFIHFWRGRHRTTSKYYPHIGKKRSGNSES